MAALTPALAHAALIYYLSGRAVLIQGPDIPHFDKLAHVGIFGLLAALVAWGLFRAFPTLSIRRVLVLTVLMGIFYGGLDEVHQYFVPSRNSDPMDLVADAFGTLAVVGGIWWARRGEAVTKPDGVRP